MSLSLLCETVLVNVYGYIEQADKDMVSDNTKVLPNQMWQDRRPHEYNQTMARHR